MSIGAVTCSSCAGPLEKMRVQIAANADKDGDKKVGLDKLNTVTKNFIKRQEKEATEKSDGVLPSGTPDESSRVQQELHPTADAVAKHKAGDSDSLSTLLFKSPDSAHADSNSSTSSSTTASASAHTARMKQWMMDAYASHYNVATAAG